MDADLMVYRYDMQHNPIQVMLSKEEILERLLGEVPDGTYALVFKTNTRSAGAERITIYIPSKGNGDAYAEVK